MAGHPTPAQIQAYAAHNLPAQNMLHLDAHVAACAECSAELSRAANVRSATGMLRRVQRAGPHLAFEQFVALTDARSRIDLVAETHLAACAACQRELAEMRGYAASLSAKVDRRDPAPSLAARLGAWIVNPRAFAATAVLALAVAISAVWQGGFVDPSGDATVRAIQGTGASQGAPRDAYDDSIFNELAALSASAHAAYQLQDFASVAKILQPLAAGGDARAQTALGLLYAEGRGVDASPEDAARWWLQAADRNASARHNLAVLRQRTSENPPR